TFVYEIGDQVIGQRAMGSSKAQLPIHADKWIVTVREGKDLTRGDGRDSFFSKMSPVCELTLGDQGPFSTSVKPNTYQPQWDDSVEFEARNHSSGATLSSTYRRSTNEKRHASEKANVSACTDSDGGSGDDDCLPLPPEGPKLGVVCYSRSPGKRAASGGGSRGGGRREGSGDGRDAERRKGRLEVGRGEVTLSRDGAGAGAGGSSEKNWIHLVRKNDSGSEVSAGSITLEYVFVPGIPRPAGDEPAEAFPEHGGEDTASGKAAKKIIGGAVGGDGVPSCRTEEELLENPTRKLTLLLTVAAMMAAVLTARLRGVYRTGVLELSPIPVPFKLAVGKHKGSSTHHIRLHGRLTEVEEQRAPPRLHLAAAAGATGSFLATTSGPLSSSSSGGDKSNTRGGDGTKDRCKRCQVKVAKDGTMALARGREELAVFSPPRARAFFDVVPPRGDNIGDSN
ncbi:unnamed protein product, partial [Scytosiphon promiscuus]